MFKKLILGFILATILMFVPGIIYAEEGVCISQYGGGVVCGISTPHEPVSAGIAGINILVIGVLFVVASFAISLIFKKHINRA